ncbi:putative ank repeat-containing [Acanthamoeba polyphaga mimivirus]|uniref:Ank repeat-containing n=1 Tax=Acanthamoeba polyphaga mimivirus Kroon TaxID=3069720 RepID=A0A0G2Y7U1_9VIRU|nr:putative ank repeat-containing [Acanthamoeba polyphaga mimivirus]AKI80619.1 putative ank repeat-containing [Acanthamoeba polyphaga mimivirus Kroon]
MIKMSKNLKTECLLPENINKYYDPYNRTTLINLTICGDFENVKILVEHGANIDEQSSNLNTALLEAIHFRHKKIAMYLISVNANVNTINIDQRTPLFVAAREGFLDIVKTLIENDADPDIPDIDGMTSYLIAIKNGHYGIAEFILEDVKKKYFLDEFDYSSNILRNVKSERIKNIGKFDFELYPDLSLIKNVDGCCILFEYLEKFTNSFLSVKKVKDNISSIIKLISSKKNYNNILIILKKLFVIKTLFCYLLSVFYYDNIHTSLLDMMKEPHTGDPMKDELAKKIIQKYIEKINLIHELIVNKSK